MCNKIGICQWSLPIDGPYICKFISELGYDGIQLDIGEYERGFPLSEDYIQKAFIEEAKNYGVEFPSITIRESDFYSMVAPKGSKEREIVIEGINKAIEAAFKMNIPIVMIPQFVKSAINTKEDFNCAVEVLKNACNYANDKGIIIATENLMKIDELELFFEKIGKSNLKLYFDTQNYYINKGYDTPSLIPSMYKYICQVHVKDGNDGELSGAPLGEGKTKFFESVKQLQNLGYKGWYISENYYDRQPLRSKGKNAIELAKKDLEILKSVFK